MQEIREIENLHTISEDETDKDIPRKKGKIKIRKAKKLNQSSDS